MMSVTSWLVFGKKTWNKKPKRNILASQGVPSPVDFTWPILNTANVLCGKKIIKEQKMRVSFLGEVIYSRLFWEKMPQQLLHSLVEELKDWAATQSVHWVSAELPP